MRYTEVEIKPSKRQVVYWSERKIHAFFEERGYSESEIWQKQMYKGPRTVFLHTGRFVREWVELYKSNDVWIEGLNIHFDLGKRKDEKEEKGDLTIWNLSSEVLFFIEVGCEVTIKSGYLDHYDTVFMGVIDEVNTVRDDGDRETTIKCKGVTDILTDKKVNPVTFFGGETFKELMDKIISQVGYSAVYIGVDVLYEDIFAEGSRFKSARGTYTGMVGDVSTVSPVKELLDKTMLQTNNYFYWTSINGRIYFIRKGYSLPAFVRLTPLTGLLKYIYKPVTNSLSPYDIDEESPEEIIATELYEIECIMIYDIVPNSLVIIQPTLTGDSFVFRIRECDYISNNDEHKVQFVAEKISVFNQPAMYTTAGGYRV